MSDIPQVTNQEMINVFARAFGSDAFWPVVVRAGLSQMAMPPGNRGKPFTGPAIEQLPNLTGAEKAALQAALAKLLEDRTPQPGTQFLKWEAHALPGLHGPADPGGGWVPEAYDVVRDSKVQAVKMLVPDMQPSEAVRLRQINPKIFIMARLFSNQLHDRRGDGTPEGTGRWFANEVAAPGDGNNPMNRAYNSDIQHFEVHNEPNLITEGQGTNWKDGAEFARFFNTVVDELRPRYPKAKFGFPGLSPGATFEIRPVEMWDFLEQAKSALARADFICCHVYWGGDGSDLQAAVAELRRVCLRFPDKLVFASEFSNNHADVPREEKANQYARFYKACQSLPTNLGAMFAYALSWQDDHHAEGFLELKEKKWNPTAMAARLGSQLNL